MGLRPDSFGRSDLIAWCAEHREEVASKKAGDIRGSGAAEAARYFLVQFNIDTVKSVFQGKWKKPKDSPERYSLALHIDGLLEKIESGKLSSAAELRVGEELIGWIAEFAITHPLVMKDRRKYFSGEEAGADAREHQERFAEQLRRVS